MNKMITVAVLMTLAGCNNFDPYAERFGNVQVGDSRERVVQVMGEPSAVNSIEVPLVRAEQLTWKSPANARVYTVRLAMDRVATKSITQ